MNSINDIKQYNDVVEYIARLTHQSFDEVVFMALIIGLKSLSDVLITPATEDDKIN